MKEQISLKGEQLQPVLGEVQLEHIQQTSCQWLWYTLLHQI